MEKDEKEAIRKRFLVKPGSKVDVKNDYTSGFDETAIDKEVARLHLEDDIERIAGYQDILYAQNRYSLLVIFQAMDAAGKDSTIKHVLSGVNPQGCQVYSFKAPSEEELDHDFLWRCAKVVPEKGNIAVFNRSYYEEVLVTRVHPEYLERQNLPPEIKKKDIWKKRFEQINNFEKHLVENGTVVLKFFLNVSKKEQKKRFLARLDRPEKNWKFSQGDVVDRALWSEYMTAYQEALSATSTDIAPWYVIPADHKPFCRLAVGYIIAETLKKLDLKYPQISDKQKDELAKARVLLENEDKPDGSSTAVVSSVTAEPQPEQKKEAPSGPVVLVSEITESGPEETDNGLSKSPKDAVAEPSNNGLNNSADNGSQPKAKKTKSKNKDKAKSKTGNKSGNKAKKKKA